MNILIAREEDGARFVFSYGEHRLGVVYFMEIGACWMWVDGEGGEDDRAIPINVDADQTNAFIAELQSAYMQSEPMRSVSEAEVFGRIRMFRDETADMAVLFGRVQAKKLL